MFVFNNVVFKQTQSSLRQNLRDPLKIVTGANGRPIAWRNCACQRCYGSARTKDPPLPFLVDKRSCAGSSDTTPALTVISLSKWLKQVGVTSCTA